MGRIMRYECVVFDLDGTLIDSLPDITATANRALAAFGRAPLDAETVRGYVGYGVRHLVERCFAGSGVDVDEAVRTFRRFYLERPCERTRGYDGVRDTLEALRGVRFGIVTNKPQAVSEAVLRTLDLERYFAVVLGGDAMPQRKPDPAPIREALRRMGAARERSLYVGDSKPDLEAGRAAGVAVCIARYGYASPPELEHMAPEFFIERFSDLLPIVRGEVPPRAFDPP
jgi:phosphoglycolate phosphatase